MPERTEQLIIFPNTGLHLTGTKRTVPRNSLRRAVGIHEETINTIRTRKGDTSLLSLSNIHSLGRLNTIRYQAAGSTIYRNGISFLTGGDGNRITFLKGQPSQGLQDYLFLIGGGQARKVDSSGTVTNWGISPPSQSLTLSSNTNNTKQIESFEDHTTWTITNGTKANEATIKQEGTNSLKLTIAADTICVIQKTVTLDLENYAGPISSPLEDHIEFYIRIANSPGFEYCLLRFDVSGGNFATNYYQFKVTPTQITPASRKLGIGASSLVNQREEDFIGVDITDNPGGDATGPDPGAAADPGPTGDASLGGTGETEALAGPDTWTRIRIPKRSFYRAGESANDWGNVAGLQFQIKTNSISGIDVYLDDLELVGSFGLEGRYRYHTTFRNTITGNRSNPEPTYIQIDNIRRQSIAGSSVPISTDTQVNQREIWRTVGNGSLFFRAFTIDNNSTTTFTDSVADYIGLNSNTGTSYLQNTTLTYDNAKPDETHTDFLIRGITSFWLGGSAGNRGRMYYSPAGRPESQKGFIVITSDNDILQRIILWNNIIFIYSLDGVYRVDGTDPYTSRRVTGVPGLPTVNKRTVTSSPHGILSQAHDGIRLFDGNRSELLFHDRLGNIFRGETLDYFPPFEGVYGAYFRDQYYISNASRTLVINLRTGLIRELGVGLNALLYEEDTQLLIGATSTGTFILEDESTITHSTFDIETGSLPLQIGKDEVVKRLRIKGIFNNQTMLPFLILDEQEIPLPSFTLTQGSIEYTIGRRGQSVSLRLQNRDTLTQPIKVEGIEVDVYTS